MAMRILATTAILPAGATFYFFVFWMGFAFWRKHRVLTYAMLFGTFLALGGAVYHWRRFVFADGIDFPFWLHVVGWTLVALACALGFVADRQIGFRVRSFAPFFDRQGRIALETEGAYAIVRHPIYSSGIWYQLGMFLVSGYLAVAVAMVVFALGALWFTRQEERRLVELLDDPAEYERYRRRVPALFPFFRRR
jgi:protein-S-isoprenylcysteine O-methyltransferase Ste14